MANILVVEDDVNLAVSIRDWLLIQGHTAETCFNGAEALVLLRQRDFDLIVLDLNLPAMSGLEVARQYRAAGGAARILVLTARTELKDKHLGFNAGADDYVSKPCHVEEIALRVQALLRRPLAFNKETLEVGDISIDINRRKVSRAGTVIKLMPQEFVLLEFLARHPNHIFEADVLVRRLWKGNASSDTVRTHIKTLRKKLDLPGFEPVIKTIHGAGYALVAS